MQWFWIRQGRSYLRRQVGRVISSRLPIGEIQVADVPGRREPGTGEINYPAIARALADLGYDGTVAMEAWASGDSDAPCSVSGRRSPSESAV